MQRSNMLWCSFRRSVPPSEAPRHFLGVFISSRVAKGYVSRIFTLTSRRSCRSESMFSIVLILFGIALIDFYFRQAMFKFSVC